jgi:hypothetical protein
MDNWKPIATAPKDETRVLLWVTRFGTVPASQSEPSAVVGRWDEQIERWKVAPEHLNQAEELFPSHWVDLPKPPTAAATFHGRTWRGAT